MKSKNILQEDKKYNQVGTIKSELCCSTYKLGISTDHINSGSQTFSFTVPSQMRKMNHSLPFLF